MVCQFLLSHLSNRSEILSLPSILSMDDHKYLDYNIVVKSMLFRFLGRTPIFRFSSNGPRPSPKEQQNKQPSFNSVLHLVGSQFNLTSDFMWAALHRYWKNYIAESLGKLSSQNIYTQKSLRTMNEPKLVLDVAGGAGDIAFRILEHNKGINVKVIVLDHRENMLQEGRKRAQQLKIGHENIEFMLGTPDDLPFRDNIFDAYTIAFGIKYAQKVNTTVSEAKRILKHGGRFMCLEFSQVKDFPFNEIYKAYCTKIMPFVGEQDHSTKDSRSPIDNIESQKDQDELLRILEQEGLKQCRYQNLTRGVVALHSGFKL